jgi:adenosylcobyric acid synthase
MESQSGSHLAKMDGCQRKNVYGTYIHGFFDSEQIADIIVGALRKKKGLPSQPGTAFSFKDYKEKQYDRLADLLRESLNMDRIYSLMGLDGDNGGKNGI